MVPIKAQGTSSRGGGTNHQASFGQRRTSEVPDRRRSGGPSHAVRGTTDGGVEISWVPSAGDAARHAAEDAIEDKRAAEAKRGRKAAAAKPEKRKGVESFGAGMERGGQDPARELADSERRGRTERRKGMRSGSKNTIFARR
jgi:ribosome biogenesis protein ENP2